MISHARYRYDGLDRRIRKFLPEGDDWTVRESCCNRNPLRLVTRLAPAL